MKRRVNFARRPTDRRPSTTDNQEPLPGSDTVTARWRRARFEIAVAELPGRIDTLIAAVRELTLELRQERRT